MSHKIKRIADKLRGRKVVFFFGAGASCSSGLPTAGELISIIIKFLFKRVEYEEIDCAPRLEKLIEIGFSYMGEKIYKLIDIFESGVPAFPYRFIVKAIENKLIFLHITTNFDVLIEKALSGIFCDILVEKNDFEKNISKLKSFSSNDACKYIKLHGTLPKYSRDLNLVIATIRGLLRGLPIWKKRILDYVFRRYTIVYVGYSMNDPDITPSIKQSSKEIYCVDPIPLEENFHVKKLGIDRSHYIQMTANQFFNILNKYIKMKVNNKTDKIKESNWSKEIERCINSFPIEFCLLIIIEILILCKKWKDALRLIEYARRKKISHEKLLEKEIKVYIAQYNFNGLKKCVSTIKRLLKKADFDTKISLLCYGALAIRRIGDKGELKSFLSQLLILRKKIKKDIKKVKVMEILTTLGEICAFVGKYDNAINFLEEAYEIAISQEIEDFDCAAKDLEILSIVLQRKNLLNKAKENIERCIEINTVIGNESAIASAYNNLGETYRRLNPKKATKYYKEALHHLELSENFQENIAIKGNIILRYIDLNELDSAEKLIIPYVEYCKEYIKKGIYCEESGNAILNFGYLKYKQGKFREAEKYFKESLMFYKKINQSHRTALAENNLGSALVKQGRITEGLKYLESAFKYAVTEKDLEILTYLFQTFTLIDLIKAEEHTRTSNYFANMTRNARLIKDTKYFLNYLRKAIDDSP